MKKQYNIMAQEKGTINQTETLEERVSKYKDYIDADYIDKRTLMMFAEIGAEWQKEQMELACRCQSEKVHEENMSDAVSENV